MSETQLSAAKENDDYLLVALEEFHRRLDSGEKVDRELFLVAHPEVSDDLRQYFGDVDFVESLAGPTALETSVIADTAAGRQHAPESGADSDLPFNTSGSEPSLGRIGRYRILSELGRGGMGAVYLAEDEQLQRRVALKVPRFDVDDERELLERFYREARAAGTLRHPGICPVFDVGEVDGQHFISMAFLEGESLRSLTQTGQPQPISVVATLVRKIAQAMAVAHRQGVIHRDLKPGNVMLTPGGEPVVMDFGLARFETDHHDPLTRTGTILGSPAYMSPEQLDADNDSLGPATDIYSLGVMFYELLTGQLPFTGKLTSIVRQIAMDDPQPIAEFRPGTDQRLESLCLRMLSRKIEARPPSMDAVASELEEIEPTLADEAFPLNPCETIAADRDRTVLLVPESRRTPEADSAVPIATEEPLGTHHKRVISARILSLALGSLAVLAAVIVLLPGRHGTVRIEINDPNISVTIDRSGPVISGAKEGEFKLEPGEHLLTVERGDDFRFKTDNFVLERRGNVVLKVEYLEGVVTVRNGDVVLGSATEPRSRVVATADSANNAASATTGSAPPPAPPQAAGFDDRELANWLIEHGAQVTTSAPPMTRTEDLNWIRNPEDLPQRPFRIEGVICTVNTVEDEQVLVRLRELSGLRWLELHHRLGDVKKDSDFSALSHLKSLEHLHIESFLKNGRWMSEIAGLTKLRGLYSLWSKVSDSDMEHLAGLTQLEELSLDGAAATGEGMVHLAGLKHLRKLHLYMAAIDDYGLEVISSLSQLQELVVTKTNISDTGLAHLPRLKHLNVLYVNGTRTTPQAIARLQDALPECRISATSLLSPATTQ